MQQNDEWPYQRYRPDEEPPPMTEQAPVQATTHHEYRRQRIDWGRWAPYLAALAGVMIAVVTLALTLTWQGSMQARVDQLRHQLAATQSQAATAANAGQAQMSGLDRGIKSLRTDVNAIANLVGPFTSQCTTDLTGPNGPAAYLFLCRQQG
jgi:hypothetical protein